MSKINQIRELVTQLNRYRHEYYNLASPSVSDAAYDRLYDELAALEQETGCIMANSPTQTVGYQVVSGLDKVQHPTPLLSLDKTHSVEDAAAFIGTRPAMLMYKYDGLTVELDYEDGRLVQASTRGDGAEGEDITHNAPAVSGIPLQIPYRGRLIVTGEAYIRRNDFEQLKSMLLDGSGKPYKNGRNLAAGSIRSFDAAACAQRRLCFTPFGVLEGLDDLPINVNSKHEKLNALEEFGFSKCGRYLLPNIQPPVSPDDLHGWIEELRAKAKVEEIPIDGIVVMLDEIDYSRSLGHTGHHFRDGLAFKFGDESVETVLRSIEWNPSRTGIICPVAVFDPVEIDGTTVSRATLHNITYIKKLALSPGCHILVCKRNQITPHVEENLDRGKFSFPFQFPDDMPESDRRHWIGNMALCSRHCKSGECDGNFEQKANPNQRRCVVCVKYRAMELGFLRGSITPEKCPCCGGETRVRLSDKENDDGSIVETLVCDNEVCPAKHIARLTHFVAKPAMNIEGLSETTLEKFVDRGWIKTYADIYHLDDHQAEIVKMDGFGQKSFGRLWAAIEASRNVTFEQFLVAADIPMVGKTASKAIARFFGGDVGRFEQAIRERFDFTQLPDFGDVLCGNIYEWFGKDGNQELWDSMKKEVTFMEMETAKAAAPNPFFGKTVVATGTLTNFTRSGIQSKIESLGGKAGSSVSKNTDYVLAGEKAGSKLDKARTLGVKVITEAQFLEMIGE